MSDPKTDLESIVAAVSAKDIVAALSLIENYKLMMRDTAVGANYVLQISDPTSLSALHKSVTDHLGIPQRAMAIRRMAVSRTQRAVMLLQAVEVAIKRMQNQ